MQTTLSACGIYDCRSCAYREAAECPGCLEGNKELARVSEASCSVFACVESSGLSSCAACAENSCVLRRAVETICPLRSKFENKRWWAGRISRALERAGRTRGESPAAAISERVVTRLRWYLTALDALASEGEVSVSSWQLAEKVGVSASLIRKDLSRFGEFGTPSFGYRIDALIGHIRSILRLDSRRSIVWIGASACRHTHAVVDRLCRHGCRVVAVFDINPAELSVPLDGLAVMDVDRLEGFLAENAVDAAVLAVPGAAAHKIAADLEAAGVKAILNMSGELLVLSDRVRVTSLDVAGELLELCYYSSNL